MDNLLVFLKTYREEFQAIAAILTSIAAITFGSLQVWVSRNNWKTAETKRKQDLLPYYIECHNRIKKARSDFTTIIFRSGIPDQLEINQMKKDIFEAKSLAALLLEDDINAYVNDISDLILEYFQNLIITRNAYEHKDELQKVENENYEILKRVMAITPTDPIFSKYTQNILR